jgi:hypothetical protein
MRLKLTIVTVAALTLMLPQMLMADNSASTNFRIDESFIGGGGRIDESSANFHAAETIGDVGVGNSASTNFQTDSGGTTTNDPALSFIINNGGAVNFGTLSAAVNNTATGSFSVYNYTSYGYVVMVIGTDPTSTSTGHTIPALTTPTAPSLGTEQWGINLVANTGYGANPLQVPSTSFSYGIAQGPNYDQPNKFMFNSGDTIASAPKSSGETDFTISYILNVGALTTGGSYTTNQELICIGTY